VDGVNAHESDLRTLEITPRERDLLLKYGYPFADEEQKLRDSKAVKGFHRVRIGAYWIELMVADLIRSAREIRNGALLDELDAFVLGTGVCAVQRSPGPLAVMAA
jgi:hypothetical protein